MPRYVILRHELPPQHARPSHWDFMLELDGALRTWALDDEPTVGQSIVALPLADHRLAYLDYEGPVFGDRGTVWRWDEGLYRPASEANGEPLELAVELEGRRLRGVARLKRVVTQAAQRWVFSLSAL